MPQKKFTDLGALAVPDDADVIAVEDVSVPATKQTTIAQARATLVTAAAVGAAGAVMDADFAGATLGRLTRTGAGTYTVVRDQLAAAVAPALTDDSSAGYSVGSRWTDTTADRIYECVDASVGAAVWLPLDRIETDAAHGNRGGGAIHALATPAANGFLSAADKMKVDTYPTVAGATDGAFVRRNGASFDTASPAIAPALDRSVSTDVVLSNATDEIVRVDTSVGNRALTLPDPAAKRKFVIKKTTTDVNTVSLVRFGAESIEGAAATHALSGSSGTTRPAWMVWSDGTNWWVA